jgi:hypothetical protein
MGQLSLSPVYLYSRFILSVLSLILIFPQAVVLLLEPF